MINFRSIVIGFITLLPIVIIILMMYSMIGLIGTLLFINVSMVVASAVGSSADSSVYPY